MTESKEKIVIVCGPTGIGKTAVAIRLARGFNGEVISADSMQIYRYMDIGTAKPTPEEQAAARHHLIDIVDPDTVFDAAAFARQAGKTIRVLSETGKLPILAGGTGLYVKALVYGLSRARPADPALLARLKADAENLGSEALHQRLVRCDPVSAARIHPNDTFRIVRALEIFEKTGCPLSGYHAEHRFARARFTTCKIGLEMDREALYQRIDQRVDMMIAAGLLQEVESLLSRGYHAGLKSMQSIGYRHMAAYLDGRFSWEEAVALMKRDTRRYAKRQFTWFRADPEIKWFRIDETDAVFERVQSFLG